MSSFILKLVACATMLADHVGLLFFPDEPLWRQVGRVALPLFAFMLAEGFIKTRSVPGYGKRLLLMAFVSQIPFSLMMHFSGSNPFKLNILFLLAEGLAMLYVLDKQPSWLRKCLVVIVALVAAAVIPIEYGPYGLLLILASYLFLRHRVAGLSLFVIATYGRALATWQGFGLTQIYALAALPFMWFYNGKQGPKRYRAWFYWFYPVHLVGLVLIAATLKYL